MHGAKKKKNFQYKQFLYNVCHDSLHLRKYSTVPSIWILILWKFWHFSCWEVSDSSELSPIDCCDISRPPVTYAINSFHCEDTSSTVSWSFGIPGRNWGDCRKQRKGPWCSWTSNWRRHSTGIHFWLVAHVKCRSSNTYYL